ncbi:carboxypeptidase-like regulatory domain-containing protein [Botrimarina sp.]|uniref:carboxypeptidase-like regulatory domain-containing protein n=1 Tax=Botrimarina sp. TaxID=2795802 RepID=UPI0032ED502D
MTIQFMQRVAAAVACVGMLAQPVVAATPVAAPQAVPAVADIALGEGGLFTGKVVNAQGAPVGHSPVSVRLADRPVAEATTNAEGVFAVAGLGSGLYTVVADNGQVTYRVWEAGIAPPVANKSALIVTGQEVLAGQYPGYCEPVPQGHPGILGWVREHPLLVGAGIAAAIAIPIAVADDDDDEPASP